jgi:hypothetical protein
VPENWGKLERGRHRLELIRDLAAGEENQTQLAGKYGVAQSSISEFAKRHAEEIRTVVGKLHDEYAGLWIANKANRVAEVQGMVEDIEGMIDDAIKNALPVDLDLFRIKMAALRQVSEELGQLPARVTVKHEGSVKMIVEGVDLANLT